MKHLFEPILWIVILIGAAHVVNAVYDAYYLPHTPFAAVDRALEGK